MGDSNCICDLVERWDYVPGKDEPVPVFFDCPVHPCECFRNTIPQLDEVFMDDTYCKKHNPEYREKFVFRQRGAERCS